MRVYLDLCAIQRPFDDQSQLRMRAEAEADFISRDGHAALVRALDVVDAIRFLNQYTTGRGDYTAERSEWLGDESLDELFEQVRDADQKREV